MKKSTASYLDNASAFIKRCETYDISPISYVVVFLCLSFIRNFLEGALGPAKSAGTNHETASALLQMATLFNLEWITLLLSLGLVISAAAGEKLLSVLKILLLSYSLIIAVPFIDLFMNFPAGCRIDYLYSIKDYSAALAGFFRPNAAVNVCPGIRLEVLFGFILCIAYIYIKTKNWLRAVAGGLALYFLAVSSMAYPVFILAPALPFTGANAGVFIRGFFYSDAYSGGMLNRTAVMIFILLAPVLLTSYALHFGFKQALYLLKKLFSPAAVAASSCLAAGWLLASKKFEFGIFKHPVDAFTLAAAFIIALLLFHFIDSLKQKSHKITQVLPVLIAVSAPAVSFPFFLICLFLLCLAALIYQKPFNLQRHTAVNHLFFAASCGLLVYTGSSLVMGPDVFSKIKPVLPVLVFFAAFFSSWACSSVNNRTGHAGLFIALLIFPVITASAALYPAAVIAALISAVAAYFIKDRSIKEAVVFLPVAALFILTGFLL